MRSRSEELELRLARLDVRNAGPAPRIVVSADRIWIVWRDWAGFVHEVRLSLKHAEFFARLARSKKESLVAPSERLVRDLERVDLVKQDLTETGPERYRWRRRRRQAFRVKLTEVGRKASIDCRRAIVMMRLGAGSEG